MGCTLVLVASSSALAEFSLPSLLRDGLQASLLSLDVVYMPFRLEMRSVLEGRGKDITASCAGKLLTPLGWRHGFCFPGGHGSLAKVNGRHGPDPRKDGRIQR